jgi:ketosteroid isomerase-like protein
MSALTTAEVEGAIRRYWVASAGKDAQQQQNCYAEHAMIFASSSRRAEPARLVSVRRHRQYMAKTTRLQVQTADIEVSLLGTEAAIASYVLDFHAEGILTQGSATEGPGEHLPNARVTQVFERDPDGELKIVHEHISLAFG